MEWLQWVEQLPFSVWVRESSDWYGYSLILTLHTIGLGLLMGISFAFDLRLLGYGEAVPLAPYERYFPYLWTGFWVNALSGVILLMADATTKLTNPVFYVKMAFIALAVWNVAIVRKRIFGGTLPSNANVLAWTSIVLWIGATTAGRLMAYIGPVAGL